MSSSPISLRSLASAPSHGPQRSVQTGVSPQRSASGPPESDGDTHSTRTLSHRSVSSISTTSQQPGSGPPSPPAQPVPQAPRLAQSAAANGATVNGQPHRAKRIVGSFEKAFVDYWAYEISAIVICVGTAVGIFAILITFQNGSSRHVMGGVTVSSQGHNKDANYTANLAQKDQYCGVYISQFFESCDRLRCSVRDRSTKVATLSAEVSESTGGGTLRGSYEGSAWILVSAQDPANWVRSRNATSIVL